MYHYRESKRGDFYLDREENWRTSSQPAFAQFMKRCGTSYDLWTDQPPDEHALLIHAGLDWPVDKRDVLVPDRRGGTARHARGYRALVRPDTDELMSVVTNAYHVAENHWVASTTLALARQHNRAAALVGAAGFGRTQERSVFAALIRRTDTDALVLLAHNSHGGEGAVRFHVIEVDKSTGAVITPDVPNAAVTVTHIGDVQERLRSLRHRDLVTNYLAETEPQWHRLHDRLWTPRHTKALLHELWGEPPTPKQTTVDGRPLHPDPQGHRHPGSHLTNALAKCDDAASAYRRICAYLDNESEACERGDFTEDRDERLTLGAGTRLKQRTWRWLAANI